jgi:hypothetical protein
MVLGGKLLFFKKKNLPPLVMAVTVFVLQNPLAGIGDDGGVYFLFFSKQDIFLKYSF